MHISLDSALGRQRRLNSVGESVLQIAPGAAAAYSLRSLTGGDPKVVRVRRGSDNHEQDFTASGVSSGALTSFVNAQVVAPLDIQALTATGRDGDFLIAKAAYSLRSLGTRQATVAATGDTVARADGKYVAQVRRSSDDAIKSFTATEITDGTLLSFVNPTYTVGTSVESASKPFDSFTSNGNDGFTATNLTTGSASAGFPYTFATGDVISVSFDLIISDNATPTFILSGNNLGSGSLVVGTTFTSSGSYTQEVTSGSGTGTHIAFTEGNTGTFTISNFKVTSHKADGFVKTWYDQSVTTQAGDTATGNHAVQATAANQPKIVNAGSLVTGGLDFDGTDDNLVLSSTLGITSAASHFAVTNLNSTGSIDTFFDNRDSSTDGYSIRTNDASNINFDWLTSDAEVARVSGEGLYYFNKTSSQTQSGANGGTLVTASESGSVSVTTVPRIGARSFTSALNFFEGTINELIIYGTDQTDNRTAIEANIGEVYSIDLPSGVDPGFDQVDGFVETWYDQSGNSNDAVQETAGSQPKIVNAGTFLSELLFEGSQVFDSITLSDSAQPNSIFTVSNTKVASQTRGIYGTNSTQAGYYRSSNKHAIFSTGTGSATLEGAAYVADRDYLRFDLFNGASSVLGVDGNTTSGTTGNAELDRLDIGDSTLSGVDPLNGGIKELILYTSDQSANRTALETNIAAKYGITLS